jgi:hypothetical protein
MPNFDSRNAFVAAGILSGLGLMAAGGTHAAEPGGLAPDLSSNDAAWVLANLDYIAVPSGPSPTRNDPGHPYVTNNSFRTTGAQPTFRVADLTNPNIKPWAKEIMKRENDRVLCGGIPYGARQSCIRHVYLDVPHSPNPKPSWYGESVGHYEGNTLVVDTIGMNDKTYLDNFRTPHSEKLHVVERHTLADDGNTLQVTFRVEDPNTFYEPWSAINNFKRIQMPMHEEACAENNQHLFDYQMPVAGKPDF